MKGRLIRGGKDETSSQSVVGGHIASPSHWELRASSHRGVWTLGHDLLDSVVVLLSIVVVRVGLVGDVVLSHVFDPDVRLSGTEPTLVPFPELPGAYLDVVGVLTNPSQYLSGCEPGLGLVGAHRSGSQPPYWVTHLKLLHRQL